MSCVQSAYGMRYSEGLGMHINVPWLEPVGWLDELRHGVLQPNNNKAERVHANMPTLTHLWWSLFVSQSLGLVCGVVYSGIVIDQVCVWFESLRDSPVERCRRIVSAHYIAHSNGQRRSGVVSFQESAFRKPGHPYAFWSMLYICFQTPRYTNSQIWWCQWWTMLYKKVEQYGQASLLRKRCDSTKKTAMTAITVNLLDKDQYTTNREHIPNGPN